MLEKSIQSEICRQLGESEIASIEQFKSVWSGFGALYRIEFTGSKRHVIVKSICPPKQVNHPKGWNSESATQRKLKSYQIEQSFYQDYAHQLAVATPEFFGVVRYENTQHLLLSDLSQQSFIEIEAGNITAVKRVISWLSQFHAQFVTQQSHGLWPEGCYWHLSTRQNEFNAITHSALKHNATKLSQLLATCPFQTTIHGDAKIANFMHNHKGVVGFDFQYVGQGIGIIDIMLLLSSAFSNEQLFAYEDELLAFYRSEFLLACAQHKVSGSEEIIDAWCTLYPVAWADFVRFLDGWSPGHWKLHKYAWLQFEKSLKMLTTI